MSSEATKRLAHWIRDASPRVNRAITTPARWLGHAAATTAHLAELHSLRIGVVEALLPNGRTLAMTATPQDNAATGVWWRGWNGYEPEMSELWFKFAAEAMSVFDIGANSGYYSILAALRNPAARIFAFEPIPRNYAALEANVAANSASSVICVRTAIGDHVGTIDVATDTNMTIDLEATFAHDHTVRHADASIEFMQCDLTTIDAFTTENGVEAVDLVKIDVELAEPFVLAGMKRVLETSRPTIFVEVLDDVVAKAVEQVAAEHGYNRFVLTPGGPVATDQVRPYQHFFNQLLTTRSAADVLTL